jgi:hypothetical protein
VEEGASLPCYGPIMASLIAFTLLILAAPPAPNLPSPPPPPPHGHRLANHLVAGLLKAPSMLPPASTYRIDVKVQKKVSERARKAQPVPKELAPYVADLVEAAIGRTAPGTTRQVVGGLAPTHRIAVDVRVDRTLVQATARLYRLPRSFWERLRKPFGELLSTSPAEERMELELRILAGAPASRVRLDKLRLVEISDKSDPRLLSSPILDMVHRDLDGDGLREIVALAPDRLMIARWSAGGLFVRAETTLDELPPATVRLRQPMGRLVVVTDTDGTLSLVVASSDRQGTSMWRYGGADEWRLIEVAPATGHWPLYALGVGQWLVRGPMTPVGVLEPGHLGLVEGGEGAYAERELSEPEVLASFHALRAFGVYRAATPSWAPHFVMATRDRGLTVWSALAPESALTLDDVGDVALVCDLDANGTPELLHTSASLEGADRLTLLELRGARRAQRRWSRDKARDKPLPPVTSLVTADVDADGWDEVVVAGWGADQGSLHLVTPQVPK